VRTLFFCLLAFVAAPAFAQDTGDISGKVISARGSEPLALVQIQIEGTPSRTVTADDGTFRIMAIPAGKYMLQASLVGYYTVHEEFELTAGQNKTFEIVLASSNEKFTQNVEVVADPFELTTQTSASEFTLEGEERKNLASVLADDPLRAVQGLPGVTAQDDFDARFSLRGADYSRIGPYLDGILLHSPFHMLQGQNVQGSATAFNGDMVEEMELHEGAWPQRFEDRTAGILDVHTRDGSRDAASPSKLVLDGGGIHSCILVLLVANLLSEHVAALDSTTNRNRTHTDSSWPVSRKPQEFVDELSMACSFVVYSSTRLRP